MIGKFQGATIKIQKAYNDETISNMYKTWCCLHQMILVVKKVTKKFPTVNSFLN